MVMDRKDITEQTALEVSPNPEQLKMAFKGHTHGIRSVAFSPDDKSLLVACGRSSELVVVDAGSLQVAKRIPESQLPWGVVTYPKAPGSLDEVE